MRKAEVKLTDRTAGWLFQDGDGYRFEYDAEWLVSENPQPVSLTLPLQKEPFTANVLFPFFDGLIPEGWLLDVAVKNWKLDPRDRMGLLLTCCRDCIGVVSVYPANEEDNP